MSLTNDELSELRAYVSNCATNEAKELERRVTEVIGDEKDYYDVEPLLAKVIDQLAVDDLWRLVRLGQAIARGEDVPFKTVSREFPHYELTQKAGCDLRLEVRKRVGASSFAYGAANVIDLLLQYGFLDLTE